MIMGEYKLKDKYKNGGFKFYGFLGGKNIVKQWSKFTAKDIKTFLKESSQQDIDKHFDKAPKNGEEQTEQHQGQQPENKEESKG